MSLPSDPAAADAPRLRGKVCVVTGAGQGIGPATVLRLGVEGGTVVLADRDGEEVAAALAVLHEQGVAAMQIPVDVGTLTGAKTLMKQVLEVHGRIDVLVNNAGGTIWIKPFHLYSEDEVRMELDRSLYPTLWCSLAVLPAMMKRKSGAIVNLDSQSVRGLYRLPNAAGRGGIAALTKAMATEYARYNIRINAVSPDDADVPDRMAPPALPRRGTPEEQAEAIAFLASDDARSVTGQVVNCARREV